MIFGDCNVYFLDSIAVHVMVKASKVVYKFTSYIILYAVAITMLK